MTVYMTEEYLISFLGSSCLVVDVVDVLVVPLASKIVLSLFPEVHCTSEVILEFLRGRWP